MLVGLAHQVYSGRPEEREVAASATERVFGFGVAHVELVAGLRTHTGISYVSSYCYIFVLILYICPHTAICVLILLYMRPHSDKDRHSGKNVDGVYDKKK
jgi:hypothetical protein